MRLVIAQVIERLEMREVPSIVKTPRTSAACLNNIRRCLAYLRESKQKVDINQLYCEQELLEGSPAAVCTVFDQIFSAYSIKINKLDKKM